MNRLSAFRVLILTLLLLCLPASASKEDLAAFNDWMQNLAVDPRVAEQVEKYRYKNDALSATYASDIGSQIRRIIARDSGTWLNLLLAGGQEPFIKVDYPEPGFAHPLLQPPSVKVEKQFEKSFVLTEVMALFNTENVSVQQALEDYTKPAFRQTVSSQLKAITREGDLSCVETKQVPLVLDPTLACNRISELHRPGLSAQHSQVVTNPGGAEYQPVYYKESLKIFVKVPSGLALYYINYSRITDLGAMSKYAGRIKITQSQQKAIDELLRILGTN